MMCFQSTFLETLAARYPNDKLTVSSATLRTRSTYRRLSSSSNVLDRFRSRSTYQGRSSRLRFSTLNEKKPPFSFSACDSRGSTAGVLTLALLTGGFGEGLPEFLPTFDFCFSLEAVYFVPFWKFHFKETESCSRVVCSFGN
ncbi:hypothetical protein BuS5_03877 [Desulfosarcina sp. BuS5]|nr:hypothetical protein BuS5_03877 [Desulfosarcina sp. BuS5]